MIIGPLWVIAVWLLVATIVSHTSGWHALAARFRDERVFSGQRWTWQSGRMRWGTNYNGCLTLGAGPEGLYIAIMWLFSFRHTPLLIPWQEIAVSRQKVLWWEFVRFQLGRQERLPFRVQRKIGNNLQAAAGTSWPVEIVE